MQRLLQFLFQYRSFLFFLLLQGVSFWLIIQNNSYQGAKYFNSTNALVASLGEVSRGVRDFFDLPAQNQVLVEENSLLKTKLKVFINRDFDEKILEKEGDTLQWEFIPARVINNSIYLQNNHITIDKGSNDGIYKGMGVVGTTGIVGQVIAVSSNFSSITSVLHGSSLVSSLHKSSGALCTTAWDGINPELAKVQYLPRHLTLFRGDTITTSGFNSIYPSGTLIGTIDKMSIAEDATFYKVQLKLSTAFNQLAYVYLANFKMKNQKDSLENSQELRYE